MPQDPADPWLNAFITAVAVASITTWLYLLGRPRNWPWLPYEPRLPVPWGFAGAGLALIFLATKVSELFVEHDGTPPTTLQMATSIPLQFAIVTIFLAAVVLLSDATPSDLGVASFWRRFGRDAKTGIIACLAAFVPVFIIQVLLVSLQGAPTKHPLVTLVEEDPSWITLAVVCAAAVIVAPVCEEITFRLLLQGWLEKWEDQKLGRPMPSTAAELGMQAGSEGESSAPTMPDTMAVAQPTEAWKPPQLGLGGMPHGWAPILLSSTAFALAHLGHGTDPIPLFPLAMILGYTYQRTHRILPCIITHALFNSATMVVLWRTVAASSN
jgi:membrane protease YdiL (CAAX protease family)